MIEIFGITFLSYFKNGHSLPDGHELDDSLEMCNRRNGKDSLSCSMVKRRDIFECDFDEDQFDFFLVREGIEILLLERIDV